MKGRVRPVSLPSGTSEAAAGTGRGRRAPHQSWHAGRHHLLADAPLPQGVPLRPARDRDEPRAVVVHPELRRAGEAALHERGEIPLDLEREARRIPASHHHQEPGGEGRRQALAPKGVVVDWAMRYGNPSIASRIEALR